MWDITVVTGCKAFSSVKCFSASRRALTLPRLSRRDNQTKRGELKRHRMPQQGPKVHPQFKTTQGGLLGGKQKRRHSSRAHRVHTAEEISCAFSSCLPGPPHMSQDASTVFTTDWNLREMWITSLFHRLSIFFLDTVSVTKIDVAPLFGLSFQCRA